MKRIFDPNFLLGAMVVLNLAITLWAVWSSCKVEVLNG